MLKIENDLKDNLENVDRDEMSDYYQVYNKRIKRWVKINKNSGLIVDIKRTKGPYALYPKGYRRPTRTTTKRRPSRRKKKGLWSWASE